VENDFSHACYPNLGLRMGRIVKMDSVVGYFLLAFHNVIVYKVWIFLGLVAFAHYAGSLRTLYAK
jgi:hypothetical protein